MRRVGKFDIRMKARFSVMKDRGSWWKIVAALTVTVVIAIIAYCARWILADCGLFDEVLEGLGLSREGSIILQTIVTILVLAIGFLARVIKELMIVERSARREAPEGWLKRR